VVNIIRQTTLKHVPRTVVPRHIGGTVSHCQGVSTHPNRRLRREFIYRVPNPVQNQSRCHRVVGAMSWRITSAISLVVAVICVRPKSTRSIASGVRNRRYSRLGSTQLEAITGGAWSWALPSLCLGLENRENIQLLVMWLFGRH